MSHEMNTDVGTAAATAEYSSGRPFTTFPLSNFMIEGTTKLGYHTATPVQAAAIEPALAGRDLVVRAKTGTGKTAAFAIPLLEHIDLARKEVQAVVLAPTRELAQQIHEVIEGLGGPAGIGAVLLVGGMPMPPQIKALESGAQVVVGTPGRILDHMKRGNLSLAKAHFAVLDEADEMVSMGFVEDVTNILKATAENRQVLLFSATVSAETERIIARFLRDPEQIFLSTDLDQVEGIEHVLYEHSTAMHKFRALLYLLDLEDPKAAIIFCNRREDAATVSAYLDRQGLDTQLISGDLPQVQRMKAMARVKAGEVRFLVATDVAARGIDISDLSHVIHFSLPQDPAVYLHRAGRTGRLGKKGLSISLVGGTDLSTRNALEWSHGIHFVTKSFPDETEVVGHRVERQVQQIREALGTLAFEAYLPTARRLMSREDGEILLAAALRAFFQWDRARKAALLGDALRDESPRDEGGRGRDEGGRGRDGRGREEGGRRREDRGRSEERPRRREPDEDLDALLVADAPAPRRAHPVDLEDDLLVEELDAAAPAANDIDEDLLVAALDEAPVAVPRATRRAVPVEEDLLADLDSLLDVEPPRTASRRAALSDLLGEDDLDSLLSAADLVAEDEVMGEKEDDSGDLDALLVEAHAPVEAALDLDALLSEEDGAAADDLPLEDTDVLLIVRDHPLERATELWEDAALSTPEKPKKRRKSRKAADAPAADLDDLLSEG